MSKGVYHRGYLPHWDFEKSLQAITFRLADSIPVSVIQRWKNELDAQHSDADGQREIHRRIAQYEDAGHGTSILQRPDCAEAIQSQLIDGSPDRYRLLEWCIMPNHVHVLIKLHEATTLSAIVQSWKGKSARRINRQLNRTGTLWQREYYDRYIRDQNHLHDSIDYIRHNPVKSGLCKRLQDWLFSSAGSGWPVERRL